MDWIEAGISTIIAVMSVNTLFLWSLHAKITELETKRKACIFCQSDVSADEFHSMKEAIKVIASHGNPYIFNNER